MNPIIDVVDYGAGNLHSVVKALEHVGASVRVIERGADLAGSGRVVLPGVGAFADGMKELRARGFDDALVAHARAGRPLLGICLGMQFLFDRSEEFGDHAGLGLIGGQVRAIPLTPGIKVPHVGWNRIVPPSGKSFAGTVLADVDASAYMYFVHSYGAAPMDPKVTIAVAAYGDAPVCAAVAQGSVSACQFHPEKSGPAGLSILRRFLAT